MKYLLAAFAMFACMGTAEASWLDRQLDPSPRHKVIRKAAPVRAKAPVGQDRLKQHHEAINALLGRNHALEGELQAMRATVKQHDDFILELKRAMAQGR